MLTWGVSAKGFCSMEPGRINGDFFGSNVRASENVFWFAFDSTTNGLRALLCATILDSARKIFPCCWFCSSMFGRNKRSTRRRSWFCAQTFVKATTSTIKGERTSTGWRTSASIVKEISARVALSSKRGPQTCCACRCSYVTMQYVRRHDRMSVIMFICALPGRNNRAFQ